MGEKSHIAWTDDTWNPWRGCTKVSPGCAHCYAEELVTRRLGGEWGPGKPRIQSKSTLKDPFKWSKLPWVCDRCGRAYDFHAVQCLDCVGRVPTHRRRVFSLSLGDWLDPEVPVAWLAQMLDTIRQCPNLDWLLLTKRIKLWRERMTQAVDAIAGENEGEFFESPEAQALSCWISDWVGGKPPPHVWLGVSVEDQKRADERIPLLLSTPAAIRFLSVEPLLEHVDLGRAALKHYTASPSTCCLTGINQVIVGGESGGESGGKRRDCGVDAIVSVVKQCIAAGVPAFCKQDSHRYPGQQGRIPNDIFNTKQFPKQNL